MVALMRLNMSTSTVLSPIGLQAFFVSMVSIDIVVRKNGPLNIVSALGKGLNSGCCVSNIEVALRALHMSLETSLGFVR